MPEDKLCFVQFIHPGGEHRPSADGIKRWNEGMHQRKFLKTRGRYFDGARVSGGEFVFWGEWEPESRVVAEFSPNRPGEPRYLYEPYYVPKDSYEGLANTDPFVFGERFHYTGCLQHTSRGPSQLRNLSPGSVILFGSRVRSRFAMDTLFVVADHIDHAFDDHKERLAGVISRTYEEVTIRPWYAIPGEDPPSFRLYFGATYDAAVDGMFSFAPCLPLRGGPVPFDRPTVRIPGVVNWKLQQGKRLNPQEDPSDVQHLWESVVEQILDQDLALGISIDLPPRVTSNRGLASPGGDCA